MIASKTRRWGGSLGLLISKRDADALGLEEEQEVLVEITPKSNVLQEMFGTAKFSKKTAQALKEARSRESKFI